MFSGRGESEEVTQYPVREVKSPLCSDLVCHQAADYPLFVSSLSSGAKRQKVDQAIVPQQMGNFEHDIGWVWSGKYLNQVKELHRDTIFLLRN